MLIHSNHLYFAVHHDRPISVSFLDRRRGREKLNKEAGTIEGRKESYDFGYYRIRLSESHILGILIVSVSTLIRVAKAI